MVDPVVELSHAHLHELHLTAPTVHSHRSEVAPLAQRTVLGLFEPGQEAVRVEVVFTFGQQVRFGVQADHALARTLVGEGCFSDDWPRIFLPVELIDLVDWRLFLFCFDFRLPVALQVDEVGEEDDHQHSDAAGESNEDSVEDELSRRLVRYRCSATGRFE